LRASAIKLQIRLDDEALELLSHRSRGTPRIANRLLRRVRDFASVNDHEDIDRDIALRAMELFEVDQLGLDRVDRTLLTMLSTKFSAKPVGLSTLAVALGEEPDTIEAVIEPYLIRSGLIQRTPRGREITAGGLAHLGIQ